MNKIYDGRPQWSNWGGLNDVQRNQVFSPGLAPSDLSFGGLAGTTHIVMRASQNTSGGKISYAVANRAYTGRLMGSYHSGLMENEWAYSVALARRYAEESFRDGSVYDANSFYASIEKRLSPSQSLNFSGFYTPNRRGKTSANTQEVFDLKGITYNSYWGYQDGEIRNSRVKTVEEPVLMFNHYWDLNKKNTLNTNIGYQFGTVGNSRLDYGGSRIFTYSNGSEIFIGGGTNPDPAYYQKMPSYFLRFEDDLQFQGAYFAEKEFRNNGQVNWNELYTVNLTTAGNGGNAVYILYEDRNDDRQLSANTVLSSQLNSYITLNSAVNYRLLNSENYARLLDLLGGTTYLDVDSFSEGDEAQNDLQNPNRLLGEDEKFKYHFSLDAAVMEGFSQARFNYKRVEFFAGLTFSHTKYQRTGHSRNGNFPDNSFGKSELLSFNNYGLKSGLTYKLSGRHIFDFKGGYYTKTPNLRNSFSNPRQNNDRVTDLASEKVQSVDVSYIYRSPVFRSRLTTYYAGLEDATEVSFYYADGISGLGRNSTTAFVQEILSGINKRHMGVEMGMEAQITPAIKLKSAVALGEHTYTNNPDLYLTSDDFQEPLRYGPSHLKNYRLPGGPQRASQVGVEYRDPAYWWISATSNFFSHAYLDIASLTRTRNFFTDADGLPIVNYSEEIARDLLKQERYDSYSLINLVGGKSWRMKQNYVGIFASVNNLLDTRYKTGGYEQSRNTNYRILLADGQRDKPIFGPKYWYGYGTTYYTHLYVRF